MDRHPERQSRLTGHEQAYGRSLDRAELIAARAELREILDNQARKMEDRKARSLRGAIMGGLLNTLVGAQSSVQKGMGAIQNLSARISKPF